MDQKPVWVSHSSISNFTKCPRLYYLHDFYKDPKTGRRMSLINPSMSLGLAVHEVLESLMDYPTQDRFKTSLVDKFELVWKKYKGKLGGFSSQDDETQYKQTGISMLEKLQKNPKVLLNKAVKIEVDPKFPLPHYLFSEKDNIILCGKVDWLEYIPETNSVHIIDFKTGKNREDEDSLQIPIYLLLAKNTQKRPVTKASYWYLRTDGDLLEKQLPDMVEAYDKILSVASRIKLARALNRFKCPLGGCIHCTPYERLLKGEGERVGISSNQDIYVITS